MRWTDSEIDWLQNNYLLYGHKDLASYLGRTRRSIGAKLSKLGLCIPTKQTKWTEEEILLLHKLYPTENKSNLIKIFAAHSWSSIKHKVQRLCIKRDQETTSKRLQELNRKYPFNYRFFKEINTENKAYLLGFILGDGCNKNNASLDVLLHKKDIEILYFMRNIMDFSGQIHTRRDGYIYLSLNSILLMRDLVEYGVIVNKTHHMSIPHVYYERDLLRGLFDSDGCIYIHKNLRHSSASIVGHKNTCEWVQGVTRKFLGISGSIYAIRNHYKWELSGRNQLSTFAKWMYSSTGFFLLRKYEKFYQSGLI